MDRLRLQLATKELQVTIGASVEGRARLQSKQDSNVRSQNAKGSSPDCGLNASSRVNQYDMRRGLYSWQPPSSNTQIILPRRITTRTKP